MATVNFKKAGRVALVILGVLLLLYMIAFFYVLSNKKSLVTQVTSAFARQTKGNLSIGDVDISAFGTFPYLAVELKQVSVTDSLFSIHKRPLLEAKDIYVRLSLWNLITKKSPVNGIKVEKAVFRLFTDSSGYSNRYLLQKNNKDSAGQNNKPGSPKLDISYVLLDDVQIIVEDLKREKLIQFTAEKLKVDANNESDGTLAMRINADIFVKQLGFNLAKGSFLKNRKFAGKFDAAYNPIKNSIGFDSIDVQIGKERMNLSGNFDLGANNPQFMLRVHTKNINYAEVRALLPEKIDTALSIVSLDKNLDASASLIGPLKGGDPLINVTWRVKNSKLTTPFLNFDDAGFDGYYTNEVQPGLPRKDPNSKIVVNRFNATWHNLPVTVQSIEILNLTEPVLTTDITSKFPLEKLNQLMGEQAHNVINFQNGQGDISLRYHGPVVRNNNTNSFLNGQVKIFNGEMLYTARNLPMKNVSALLTFANSDLNVENLHCEVLGNKINMNGTASQLLTLINTEPNKVNLVWNVESPSLNLTPFTYLLKKRTRVVVNKSGASIGQLTNKIDQLLEQGKVDVNLKAGQVTFKKFRASNLTTNLVLLQDRYLLNNVQMNCAGGSLKLNGSLVNMGAANEVTVNADFNQVDVQSVFESFENFGQKGIEARNLRGQLTSNADVKMRISDEGVVLPKSVSGIVKFSLKNGALVDFEPVKKAQVFVFKNRNFDNIQFAEIKNTLNISNGDIRINRMVIESTVLRLFVEGLYSTSGNSDISLQVPLDNLKKRDSDYILQNIRPGSSGGRSIYLRGRTGSDGAIKFTLDLFKKYQKEKEKKDSVLNKKQ